MVYKSTPYKKYECLPPNGAWEKLLKHVKPGSTVLDFGCYEGGMGKILKKKHQCLVYGIEINKKAAQKARKHIDKLIVGDIEKIDFTKHFKEKMFDTFVFGDVLEHLEKPDTLLEKTRPFLNDDGFVLASIPNVAYAGIIFDLLQGEFNYSKEGLLDRNHIRFFTKDEVYYLFERTGFYVSNLDRVITEFPQYSEFHTDLSRYSQEIVAEILKNKENLTYQFIVRAEKTSEANLIKYLKIKNRLLKMKWREATSSEKKFSEADIKERLGQKNQELCNRDQVIRERESRINELGVELQKRDEVIGQKEKEIFARDQRIEQSERKIGELTLGLQKRDEEVGQKDKELWNRDQVIRERESRVNELGVELQKRDEVIGQKDKDLYGRDQNLEKKEKAICELGVKLQERDQIINQKDAEIVALRSFIKSRKWWEFWKWGEEFKI